LRKCSLRNILSCNLVLIDTYLYSFQMTRTKRVSGAKARRKSKGLVLQAAAEKGSTGKAKRSYRAWLELNGLYRPLKKPVTLRLDADVLAWFKKDGRRYQTRINRALRLVMEREMKAAEE
jgi:uncharacterized protein (DUF4415 family)